LGPCSRSPPAEEPRGEPTGEDAEWLAEATARVGAVVGGRWTYEAARLGATRTRGGCRSSSSRTGPRSSPRATRSRSCRASRRPSSACEAAGGRTSTHGGADVIRQALAAGLVDELTIIIAPVVLGGGTRLFEGFRQSLDLEHVGVRQSRFATFIDYRVKRA
jgi:RibD C-terminal domain